MSFKKEMLQQYMIALNKVLESVSFFIKPPSGPEPVYEKLSPLGNNIL